MPLENPRKKIPELSREKRKERKEIRKVRLQSTVLVGLRKAI